jgi:uncharacterized membrane protein
VLAESFFARQSLGDWGFRWLHILAGIMWIGLLYYFNFVQVPAFAAFGDEARARNIAIDKVARKALWWFRWAAVFTFVTGILITLVTENYFSDGFGKNAGGIAISTGMLLGINGVFGNLGVGSAALITAPSPPSPSAAGPRNGSSSASRTL